MYHRLTVYTVFDNYIELENSLACTCSVLIYLRVTLVKRCTGEPPILAPITVSESTSMSVGR